MLITFFVFVAIWRTYEKAGQPGWAAIIPIYNWYVLIKIAGKPGWWLLLFIIPGVNFIFMIWIINLVSKSFGKDEGFTVGLLLLGFIFWPILGYGDANTSDPMAIRLHSRPRQTSLTLSGRGKKTAIFFETNNEPVRLQISR